MWRPLTLEQAKLLYPNRFTMEHIPAWANRPVGDTPIPKFYAPQYQSDEEWYNYTSFPDEEGHPEYKSKRATYCYSTRQTWPLGRWLDYPYSKAKLKLELETISNCYTAIKQLRLDILTALDSECDNLPPRAEQDWLAALAHLELAAVDMQRCDYHRK
jgi:hypothetical protein